MQLIIFDPATLRTDIPLTQTTDSPSPDRIFAKDLVIADNTILQDGCTLSRKEDPPTVALLDRPIGIFNIRNPAGNGDSLEDNLSHWIIEYNGKCAGYPFAVDDTLFRPADATDCQGFVDCYASISGTGIEPIGQENRIVRPGSIHGRRDVAIFRISIQANGNRTSINYHR